MSMSDTPTVAGQTTDRRIELTTWKNFTFTVRPARPDDEAQLADLFNRVTPEDRRFRFLSGVERVTKPFLERLTQVDHDRTEDFLAFDEDTLIATAMMAADSKRERAEVAISIRSDYKDRGIGWALLDYVAKAAREREIGILESIESRENRKAISLEREMGFEVIPYPEDATLVLVQKKLN